MKTQIAWIVGNLHVWTPWRDVVRHFAARMCDARSWKARFASKAFRKQIYRLALEAHADNQSLVKAFRL